MKAITDPLYMQGNQCIEDCTMTFRMPMPVRYCQTETLRWEIVIMPVEANQLVDNFPWKSTSNHSSGTGIIVCAHSLRTGITIDDSA